MTNHSKKQEGTPRVTSDNASVGALASCALSVVAERNAKAGGSVDEKLLSQLRTAAIGEPSSAVHDVIETLRTSGVSPDVIATHYIPQIAIQLGAEWVEDTLSFARVTIGTSRLQASLRTLGREWTSYGHSEGSGDSGTAIAIIARDPFHTLGSLILCGQLRRLGHSVRVSMGASQPELQTLIKDAQFDAIFISATQFQSLDSLRKCVDVIRHSASDCPPIILGGSALDQDADMCAETGADFATKDPNEALEFCGLTKTNNQPHLTEQRI